MRIYVGNLSYNTEEAGLEAAFSAFGTVTSSSVVRDRETGRSRGFGFVEMASADEGTAAINGLNDSDVDGRTLTVNEARPRAASGGGGGGYRTGRW